MSGNWGAAEAFQVRVFRWVQSVEWFAVVAVPGKRADQDWSPELLSELVEVAAAWPALPEAVRVGILAMVIEGVGIGETKPAIESA